MSNGERLSALDTSFFHAESSRTPMHVAAVVRVDDAPLRDEHGRVRLDELREYLRRRLHLAPRLRQVSLSLRQSFARRSDSGTRALVRNEQQFPLFSTFCKSSDAAGATVASKLRCQPQTQWQGRAG